MTPLREIEWSKFSQNGEDGIIDYLIRRLQECGRTFVEIGSGSGKQNNTTCLAQQGWSGTVFDRRPKRIDNYRKRGLSAVAAHIMEVKPEHAADVLALVPRTPDVFSLDIDGFDYHVAAALLGLGFRPAIAVLEYNASFVDDPVTIPYPLPLPVKHSYFGCGVAEWRKLFEPAGYSFVTVETAGVNAFFVRVETIPAYCLADVEWLSWADCRNLEALDERRAKLLQWV